VPSSDPIQRFSDIVENIERIERFGNRLRHDYGNIDVVRIWLLIERDLPPLKAACSGALQILKGGDQSR
jgi:uncharacterized protein with HEPN domain